MTAATAVVVALYLRISDDPKNNGQAVKRQEKEARARIAHELPGSTIVTYVDNDTSANGLKSRPKYEQMLRDARDGAISVIACWSVDRLTRAPREIEDVLDLHDQKGVRLLSMGGVVDLATPFGRAALRIYVAFARLELEQRRYRQLAERRQHAEAGRVHKGGKRPFGYCADKMHELPAEAELVREAARRTLAGESLRGLCDDFAQRGIVGTTGSAITPSTMRSILCSARISGRREHFQAQVGEARPSVIDDELIVATGEWDAIISVEDGDALRKLLTSPARQSHSGNARAHLLPGFLQCGTSVRPMQSHRMQTTRKGAKITKAAYVCAPTPGIKCSKQISGEPLEARVVELVLAAVDSPKFEQMLHEKRGVDRALVEQLAADRSELEQLAADKANGELTRDEWRAMRSIIVERITAAEATIDAQTQSDALNLLRGDGDIETRFAKLTLDQKRSVLRSVVDAVVVHPPSKMGRTFDKQRVEIRWAA